MGRLSSMINGLARSLSAKKSKVEDEEREFREAAALMARDAKKNHMLMKTSGFMHVKNSRNSVAVHTKRGQKGQNQDSFIVWEKFAGEDDFLFCGIFDGHGDWGHFIAKKVRDALPSSLLCQVRGLSNADAPGSTPFSFDVWRHSFLKSCAAVDSQLTRLRNVDSFRSGTTALSLLRQGDYIVIANVGDSRAVLGTGSGGTIAAVQLTVDFKPDLPQEEARIIQSNGRVFCLKDETGVHRVWRPDGETPGLAMSRAFGDYCVKEYGVTSVPDVTHRRISGEEKFVILATDGVWDVLSNEEAVRVVSETAEKADAARRLVECAGAAWKKKRKGIAMDDISAICLFFDSA